MFDVGFAELVLCFVVALVVLGPQKLPALARALGYWTGRARIYVRNFSAELEREAGTAPLRRELDEVARTLQDGAQSVRKDLERVTDPGAPPTAPPERKP